MLVLRKKIYKLLPKSPQKLNFLAKLRFSMSKLDPHMQKAIIAHFIIEYITFFPPESYIEDRRSIRERILDRSTFNTFVLKKLK
jgi:hypothetical protein